jgi:hypothetical protein
MKSPDSSKEKAGRNHRPFLFLALGFGVFGLLALIAERIRLMIAETCLKTPKQEGMAEVLSYLQEHLGSAVAAYLSGAESPDVFSRWLAGVERPPAPYEERLRPAFEAARSIVRVFDDETARQWFGGMNPSLEDDAPASVLRYGSPERCISVVSAAMEFVETAR